MPSAPVSIIPSATPAHIPYERQRLSFAPAAMMTDSEIIDSSTTAAVTIICMTS